MGTLGPGMGLLGAYAAGVGGNVAGLFYYAEPHRGLGASGMVLGALGLLSAQSFAFWRSGATGKQLIWRGLMGGILLLVLLGFNPDPRADIIAHVSGFVSGIVLGGFVVILPERVKRNRWTNRLAILLCASLILGTWWLAIR